MPPQPNRSKVTQIATDPEPHYATIPLDKIVIGAQDIRSLQQDDEITALAVDIAARGLLQPIVVSPLNDGTYQLRAGKRRLQAYRLLRRTTISAQLLPANGRSLLGDALAENLFRRPMTLQEECDAIARFDAEGRTPDEIADLVHHSRSWVLKRLAIPNLPADLQEAIMLKDLAVGAAEALAALDDEGSRRLLTTETLNAKLSVAQVREAVATWQAHAQAQADLEPNQTTGPQLALAPIIAARCQLCGATHDQSTMPLIRVCPGGCKPPTPPTQQEEPNDGREG